MSDDKAGRKTIDDLLGVMAALRAPETGCPWDLAQDFASIAPYTIEEAYEVADAIERRDMAALKHELGDLLLQVVYHARLAEETNSFAFQDVVEAITQKMIRRHPHVFGDDAQRQAGAPDDFWERIKDGEKAADKTNEAASILDDVPLPLPALTRAVKLQNKAARVGFDWPDMAPVFAKMKEELLELEAEIGGSGNAARIEEEYGDLLFVIANVARHLKIDPEKALRGANAKFIRRFQRIEALLAAMGRTPAQSDLAEMDRLWDRAKLEERGK